MSRKPIPIIAYMPDGSVVHYDTLTEALTALHTSAEKILSLIRTGEPYVPYQNINNSLRGATFDFAIDDDYI